MHFGDAKLQIIFEYLITKLCLIVGYILKQTDYFFPFLRNRYK